jgi:hypothetical protein
LLDLHERWWTDEEIDRYITAWQNRIQDETEVVWSSGTLVVGSATSTITLTAIATDILRVDAIYWDKVRLVGKTKEELDLLNRNWRNANPGTPQVVYQDNEATLSLWPTPVATGTLVSEHPKMLTFATDTSTMQVPGWMKYSVVNYCLWRAFSRFGPNQDQNVAARRRARFEKQLRKYKSLLANIFPHKYPSLRPGGGYEKDILQPETPDLELL